MQAKRTPRWTVLNQHPGRIDWNIRPADVFDPSVLTLLVSNAVVIVWAMVAGVLKAEHPEADKALCRCREIECLQGPDAHHYAKEHLKAVETDGGWRTTYI